MALRLYVDECVDARIAAGLRRRGVDLTTVAEEGLLGAADEHHLRRAKALGRVVVTSDHDFLQLAHEWAAKGEHSPGVLFILPRSTVGDAVRAIALAAEALDPEDVQDWIEWIPG